MKSSSYSTVSPYGSAGHEIRGIRDKKEGHLGYLVEVGDATEWVE